MKEIKITKEQARLMHESGVPSLISIAESNFPELFHKEKKWEEFGQLKGYYTNDYCETVYYEGWSDRCNREINPTDKECEMDIAMCQLRHWRDRANGEQLDKWCDWSDREQEKHSLVSAENKIKSSSNTGVNFPLTFKTEKIMHEFFKDHFTLIHTAHGLEVPKDVKVFNEHQTGCSFDVKHDKNWDKYLNKEYLFRAIDKEMVGIVSDLLDQKQDLIKETDEKGNTPLHLAVFKENKEMIKLLLDKGADLRKTNDKQRLSPLYYAVSKNKELGFWLLTEYDSFDKAECEIGLTLDNYNIVVSLINKEEFYSLERNPNRCPINEN